MDPWELYTLKRAITLGQEECWDEYRIAGGSGRDNYEMVITEETPIKTCPSE
jgi:hypothetical protein